MEAFWRLGAGGSGTWLAGHLASLCRSYPCMTGDLNNLGVHEIMQVFFHPSRTAEWCACQSRLFYRNSGFAAGPSEGLDVWICTPFVDSMEGGFSLYVCPYLLSR